MSFSERLKDINDNESNVEEKNFYIERNCSNCKTCMKVSIKNLPKFDYCLDCKINLLTLVDAVK